MKVKCIDNKGVEGFLTVGEIYSASESSIAPDRNMYDLIDDDGSLNVFDKDKFEVLEDEADMVNHPSHYNYKSMECKDIIKVMTEGLEGEEAYYMGAIVKYLYRYPKKGKAVEDLNKAITYINMTIEKLESEE